MSDKRIDSAEHVLPGHPDKLCDALVDAVVDHVRRGRSDPECRCEGDPDGQCGLEAAVIFGSVYLTGRIAARRDLLYCLAMEKIAAEVYHSAGYGMDPVGHEWKPNPKGLGVCTQLCMGEFEEGEREARHLSDDQAICVGYANDSAETDHLPPAHWLARRIGRALFDLRAAKGAGQVGPDGKVLVTVETDGRRWRPLRVSISLNHHERSDWLFLRRFAEEAVETACGDWGTPEITLNGAGMFVAGGPNGDNGLSGKKLVVDAYGPTVPIGGGAWSGKDFHKVDRLGGLLARSLAKKAVKLGLAREALITLEYAPGCDRPSGVHGRLDGKGAREGLLGVLGDPEIRNQPVWADYVSCDAELVEIARWGHQRAGVPWE